MTRPHLTAHAHRLLLASLLSLLFSGACSDDEEATVVPPVDLALAITAIDGSEPDAGDPLLCSGTLVQVEISPARGFTLRPLHACGSSSRCGYVHVEGLDAEDNVLGSVDSVTTVGLLELSSDALPQLAAVRAVLLRGIDGEPVTNADMSEVQTRVEVSRPAAAGCQPDGVGGQGQGGARASAGAPGQGGAGGAAAGGAAAAGESSGGTPASELGGAGGATASTPNAGSGGV